MSPSELEKQFSETEVPEDPIFVSDQADFLMNKVVAQSVHTAAPSFLGHMTSAMPYFMMPLAKIMIALNQNLVKIETSKAFTPLERQVIGIIHRLIYEREDRFYSAKTHNPGCALGAFCSDGTIANITALWVALNKLLGPTETFDGVGQEGIFEALKEHKLEGLAVLVSERGHYSLQKAANLLGIGKRNLIKLPLDESGKMSIPKLRETIKNLRNRKIGIVAAIGIAGTTETGHVDPLDEMGEVCESEGIFYHVDAAWGGPTLFSNKYKHLLKGIEKADSVTLDAHKQLYVPVGAGMVLFQDETALNLIEHSAQYIIRRGSRDIGRRTLEGSRPGMAMLVHSGLKIIGRKGYELLINLGIEKAQLFAQKIKDMEDFELITEPELNLLTYRYIPKPLRAQLDEGLKEQTKFVNDVLNKLTVKMQKQQREDGKSFVSRTAIRVPKYDNQLINVFRVVLANPLTQEENLDRVLQEQKEIGERMYESI